MFNIVYLVPTEKVGIDFRRATSADGRALNGSPPKGSRVGPLSDSVALPPVPTTTTLTLKLFHGERAISTFDDTFNPPHRSSPSFSTLVSSDLHGAEYNRIIILYQPLNRLSA
jgi:hypothetical protein